MAGSSVIGALRVTLGLDSATFSTGAKSAEQRAEQLGYRIGRSLRSAAGEVSAFASAFAVLGSIAGAGALGVLASQGLEYASSLAEVAQQLGVTTKDLQTYRYAASQVGISNEEMDKALSKLTVNMGKAREGVKEPVAAFKELSDLLGKDVLKSSATAGDAIPLIAAALAKVTDPAKRAAIEVALFGKTGQKLDTLLASGSDGVNQLTKAAQDLGLVLSDDQIANADATADKLSELKQVLEANIAKAVADNAGSIFTLATSLESLTSSVLKFLSSNPQTALAIMGAMAGSRVGLPGAAAGAIAGYAGGSRLGQANADANMDVQFRAARLREAARAYRSAKTARASGGLLSFRQAEGSGPQDVAGARSELIRQQGLANAAIAARANRKAPVIGGAGAGVSAEDKASAARKADADAKRLEAERKRAAEKERAEERHYQDELGRSRNEQLNAELDLTANQDERVNIQQKLLDNEKASNIESIRLDKNLTDGQKNELIAQEEATALLRSRVLHRQDQEILARQALERAKAENDNASDVLTAQAGLARTAKERGALELRILDLQFDQLRLVQQAIVDSQASSDQEKAQARDRLKTLGSLQGLARMKSQRDNAGPLQQYFDAIPKGADEMNEALQRVEADGLSSLVDGLSNVEGGFKSLADTVSNVSNQILSSLLKIALNKGIAALFGAIFPSAKGAIAGSDLLSSSLTTSLGGSFTGTDPLGSGLKLSGARAKGGPVIGGRAYLVGEKGPEPFIPTGSGTILPNDALGGGNRTNVTQNISIPGGIDLMTRAEGYRVAAAVKDATIAAISDRNRRRG